MFFISFVHSVFAQNEPERKTPRILILLDESSSMIEKWEGDKPRYKAADEIILHLMDSIYKVNNNVEFGLRVFGHQHTVPEHNCYDTKREVMFSRDNYTQMLLRLADIRPLGVTPIAYSLKEAADNDLVDEDRYAYSIVLITDGGESCGGNICEVVKELLAKKIYFRPYIVSLVDYAPLRTEYACLGEYLQVTNEKDIPKTIDSIVTAFRPALTLTTAQYKQFLETKILPPSIQKISVPEVTVAKTTPEPVKAEPVPRAEEPLPGSIKTFKNPGITYSRPAQPSTPATVNVPKPAEPAPEPRVKETIAGIQHTRYIGELPLHYGSRAVKIIKTPDIIMPQPEPEVAPPIAVAPPPKPVVKPKPKPKPVVKNTPAKDENKPMEYAVETEDAKETTVEVYFEDNKGNFYATTPQLNFIDPRTGNPMKTFWRTVDAKGNPDPQNVPSGTYNIAVTNSKSTAYNVQVEANKKNKIFLHVHNATLSFAYAGNPTRPMQEFQAIVTHRELGGKQIMQKCTSRLEYEPGNYHISINTLPPSERNVDLDVNDETIITLAEPGFVQFTNTNPVGNISLYCPLGDRFVRFYSMKISGEPASQKLQLQPGIYKVHFAKNPNMPNLSETVVDFRVESNKVAEVELK